MTTKGNEFLAQWKTLNDEQQLTFLLYVFGYYPKGIDAGMKFVKEVYHK